MFTVDLGRELSEFVPEPDFGTVCCVLIVALGLQHRERRRKLQVRGQSLSMLCCLPAPLPAPESVLSELSGSKSSFVSFDIGGVSAPS